MPDKFTLISPPPPPEETERAPHRKRVRLDIIALCIAGASFIAAGFVACEAHRQADIAQTALIAQERR